MHRALALFLSLFVLNVMKAAAQLHLTPLSDSSRPAFSLRPLPQNFYKQGLPFFCRQELQLQKITSLPLYFRVGSKDYVDYLEKKPNATATKQ